jgi:hypothetical protein
VPCDMKPDKSSQRNAAGASGGNVSSVLRTNLARRHYHLTQLFLDERRRRLLTIGRLTDGSRVSRGYQHSCRWHTMSLTAVIRDIQVQGVIFVAIGSNRRSLSWEEQHVK